LPRGSECWDAALLAAWGTGWEDYFGPDNQHHPLILLAEIGPRCSDFETWCKTRQVDLLWIVKMPGLNCARLRLPLQLLEALSLAPGVVVLQLGQALRPRRKLDIDRDPRALGPSLKAPVPVSDAQTLIAVIDHGCPFAHPLFRSARGAAAAGTRVHAIWDQDPRPEFLASSGTMPRELGSGRQVVQAQLDAWIAEGRALGLDDHALYERVAYRALRARWTHGAAALGVADNAKAGLVFVQLPRSSVIAPSAGAIDVNILEALIYIDRCRGPRTKRVQVLIDYGSFLGPHDGSSLFERTLDAFLADASRNDASANPEQRCFEVVFATGNGHDKAIHASLPAGTSPERDHALDWLIPPGSEVGTQAELWIDAKALPLSVFVQVQAGLARRISLNSRGTLPSVVALGQGLHAVIKPHHRGPQGQQVQVLLCANAQARHSRRVHVELRLGSTLSSPLHAYSVWGGRNPGVNRAIVPPRFVLPTGKPTAWTLNSPGSLLGSACGQSPHVLLVGGFEAWAPYRRAPYACGGPARAGRRSAQGAVPSGNDCVAVCEEQASLAGLRLNGVSATSTVRVNGTSFAAPQVVRSRANGEPLDRTPPAPLPPAPRPLQRDEFGEPRWPAWHGFARLST
jgi:hypothetical protein